MAITPVQAVKTVTTAATAVRFSTGNEKPSSIYFEALGTNTGYIYIGLSNVSATNYIARLSAGQGFTMSVDGVNGINYRAGGMGLQLSDYWADCSVNGEKVCWTYMYATGG